MPKIDSLEVGAYSLPTEAPQSDGTMCWTATSAVVVRVRAAGVEGLGYAYNHPAAARVVDETLKPLVLGKEAFGIEVISIWMGQAIRNFGRSGVCAGALSAVDAALWDLKARLLGVPLVGLLGAARPAVPVYGSGGFTSYDKQRLADQAADWAKAGIRMVKIKVGTRPADDVARVRDVADAVGDGVRLFVDAGGAYTVKQALMLAERFALAGVAWLEEPVSSDDLVGLRRVRERAAMDVAAGEYGHDASYFRAMLAAGAVDVLQADATRCGGPTGFRKAAALAEGFHIPLSAHQAPGLHLHLACAAASLVHLEWFDDHARLERILFDGVIEPAGGMLAPDLSRPGHGLTLKEQEAARYAV